MSAPHHPETGDFAKHLARLGHELDAFLADDRPDPATHIEQWSAALGGQLPATGIGADGVMDELAEVVIANGSRLSDPGFWAFITGGPTTMPVAASTAAMIASPQRYTITAFNHLEELSLRWLAELSGLPSTMQGVYVSGGSVANLVALGAARQSAFESVGLDPANDGLDGRPVAIYASREVHHTVQRAAGVLGLGRSSVVEIATDERQRMQVDALRHALEHGAAQGHLPVAVVATAGTTNTGAIDPIRATGELAREHGAWFHVDGAYGLLGCLDARVADAYEGIELADSVIVDPHKWLNTPVGIAAAFVQDPAILHRAFTQGPSDYLEGSFVTDTDAIQASMDSMGVPYADLAVELSAPARGVAVWAALREIGREGVTARIVADNDLARQVTDLATAHPSLEALTNPQLSIACLRYIGPDDQPRFPPSPTDLDAVNRRILRRLHRESSYLPSSTVVNGRYALRPCFINARTRPEQIPDFIDTVATFGDQELLALAGEARGS